MGSGAGAGIGSYGGIQQPGQAATGTWGSGGGGGGIQLPEWNYMTGGSGGSGVVIIRYLFQN